MMIKSPVQSQGPTRRGAILYLDTELRPHRSLSKRGLFWVLGALLVFNLLIALFLFAIGAYPVPLFLGLDFVGVLIAFHVSNRRAGGGERVQVTHDEVRVIGLKQGRAMTLWSSPTAFTRVEIDKADGLVARVRVRLRDRSHALADALGPAERAQFAMRLQTAMRSALAERHA
jgi:uncharacterized membrane protein